MRKIRQESENLKEKGGYLKSGAERDSERKTLRERERGRKINLEGERKLEKERDRE